MVIIGIYFKSGNYLLNKAYIHKLTDYDSLVGGIICHQVPVQTWHKSYLLSVLICYTANHHSGLFSGEGGMKLDNWESREHLLV
jgi:hypothetical protein